MSEPWHVYRPSHASNRYDTAISVSICPSLWELLLTNALGMLGHTTIPTPLGEFVSPPDINQNQYSCVEIAKVLLLIQYVELPYIW